jgi:cytoskeletal protein CcmA (bactofilin family)
MDRMALFGKQTSSAGSEDVEATRRPTWQDVGSATPSAEALNTNQGGAVASIGKSIVFKGDLSGDEDLEIDGTVEGSVQLPNNHLTVAASGQVSASINAKSVTVVGRIVGNVTATERVEVESTGVVEGDIRAPRLLISEGAVVNGSVEMSPRAAPGQPVSVEAGAESRKAG